MLQFSHAIQNLPEYILTGKFTIWQDKFFMRGVRPIEMTANIFKN